MTDVLRQPLIPTMASNQRPARRRSARADDEETAPPAKRARMDDGTNGELPPSTAANTTRKKPGRKAAEPDDGFTFSRVKARKGTADAAVDKPVLEKPATDAKSGIEPEKGAPRRKKGSLEGEGKRPARRSARLSGERAPAEPLDLTLPSDLTRRQTSAKQQEKRKTGDKQQQAREGSPAAPVATELRVEKKRGAQTTHPPPENAQGLEATTKIALPFQDTPIITRNREMRQSSGQSMRRRSGSLRGRRASSLIDKGNSNAMPHSEVRTADFYKHIAPDIIETRRMKQLLMWCASRAMPERPTGSASDVNAVLAARTIEEELLKDFANKSEMSDWYDRVESAPEILVKKPNPRNQQNAAKLKELLEQKKRLEAEKASWAELLTSFSKTQSDAAPTEQILNPHRQLDADHLSPSQTEILQSSESHKTTISGARTRLTKASDALEFKIDSLADGVHKINKLRLVLDETVDRVQARAGEALDGQETGALQRAGMDKVGVHDLLRGLSRAAQR